jgi:hypothetical protein
MLGSQSLSEPSPPGQLAPAAFPEPFNLSQQREQDLLLLPQQPELQQSTQPFVRAQAEGDQKTSRRKRNRTAGDEQKNPGKRSKTPATQAAGAESKASDKARKPPRAKAGKIPAAVSTVSTLLSGDSVVDTSESWRLTLELMTQAALKTQKEIGGVPFVVFSTGCQSTRVSAVMLGSQSLSEPSPPGQLAPAAFPEPFNLSQAAGRLASAAPAGGAFPMR